MNDRAGLVTATAALLAGACCIGLAAVMVKLSPVGPQASAFWRLLIAAPALVVWAVLERKPGASATPWLLLMAAGVLFAGDLVTWHAGIVRTSAANATFLANLTPVVVVAWVWIFERKPPKGPFLMAVGLALAGSLLMSGGAPGANPESFTGDALSAATSLWYAAYLLVITKARTQCPTGLAMLVSTLAALPLAFLATLASGEPFVPATGFPGPLAALAAFWPLLVLGLVSHAGGQGLLAFGLGRVPVALASVLILIQPVMAGLAGWSILGEALGPVQLAGGALVLSGVWLARKSG